MNWLKRKLPKKKWKRAFIYLLSIFLILIACDMTLVQYWRQIRISFNTTRILTPLTPDGQPDYAAALNQTDSEGVTAENNAAIPLAEITGLSTTPPPYLSTDSLQTPAEQREDNSRLKNYFAWLITHRPSDAPTDDAKFNDSRFDQEDRIVNAPWKSADIPLAAQWLSENHENLTKLHAALQRDHFYIMVSPTNPLFGGQNFIALQQWFAALRKCNMLLLADAMRSAGDQDFTTFHRDIVDAQNLATLVYHGSSVMQWMVAISLDVRISRSIGAAAPYLSEKESRQLLAFLQQLPPVVTPAQSIDRGERYFMLSALSYSATYGVDRYFERVLPPGAGPSISPLFRALGPINFNRGMEHANYYYDKLTANFKLPTYKDRLAAQTALNKESETLSMWSLPDMLISTAIPVFQNSVILHQRTATQRTLAQLSLALSIYHSQHNTYPDSLTTLVPAILPDLPTDEFADAPFHYHRTPAGYLLYSVGPDGQDDGGADRKHAKKGNYDITVQFPENVTPTTQNSPATK